MDTRYAAADCCVEAGRSLELLPRQKKQFLPLKICEPAQAPAGGVTDRVFLSGYQVDSGAPPAFFAVDVGQRFCQGWRVEAATYSEFPFVDAIATTRKSWLAEWTEAVEKSGPIILRAYAPLVLDVSRQRVHELIQQGRLKVVNVRDVQWVTVESLDAYLADAEHGGKTLNVERYWLRRLTDRQKKVRKRC